MLFRSAVAPEDQKTETPVEDTEVQPEQPIQQTPKETAPVEQGQEENIDGIY